MFTRVLLNITKHKVLNILLIFLLIISFIGITVSSVFAYKTTSYLNSIYENDDYVILSSSDYTESEFMFEFNEIDLNKYFEAQEDINAVSSNISAELSASVGNLDVKQFESELDDLYENEQFDYENSNYVMLESNLTYLSYEYNIEDITDFTKVYIDERVAEVYELSVGDMLDIETYDVFSMEMEYTDLGQVEIGGILEPNFEAETSDVYGPDMIVFIPVESLRDFDTSTLMVYESSLIVTSDNDSDVEKAYDVAKDYSDDMYVEYSKNLENEDLDFFVRIRNFFTVALITSIVVLALSMASLNNNIMERRNDEFRLYNVFGVGNGEILIQLILEKIALILLSLIIAVPLFLRVIHITNNVLDNIVEYSLYEDMSILNIAHMTMNQDLVDILYNGTSAVDYSKPLIILFGILAMIVITLVIVAIQFVIRKNSIVNQRRGE